MGMKGKIVFQIVDWPVLHYIDIFATFHFCFWHFPAFIYLYLHSFVCVCVSVYICHTWNYFRASSSLQWLNIIFFCSFRLCPSVAARFIVIFIALIFFPLTVRPSMHCIPFRRTTVSFSNFICIRTKIDWLIDAAAIFHREVRVQCVYIDDRQNRQKQDDYDGV